MLSDASVEKQCQLCAQDVSENYDEERLDEFVKESRQTPSPDDWIGKMGEDEAWGPVYLQTVKPSKNRPLAGNPWGAVYDGRYQPLGKKERKGLILSIFRRHGGSPSTD